MNTLDQLKAAVDFLSAIDPILPRALLIASVLVIVYAFRKLFPGAWEWFARAVPVAVVDPAPVLLVLSKAWQALPGALLGALTLGLSTGQVVPAVKGAVFGALAALAHEIMKAVPWIPYQGKTGDSDLPPGAGGGSTWASLCVWMTMAAILCLAAVLQSCSGDQGQDVKTAISVARGACKGWQVGKAFLPKPVPEAEAVCPLLLAPPAIKDCVVTGEGGAGGSP